MSSSRARKSRLNFTNAGKVVLDARVELQVVYLMRDGQPVAAVVPADVATAGAAAVEALEEAEDIRVARAALADRGPRVPLSEILAEYADAE